MDEAPPRSGAELAPDGCFPSPRNSRIACGALLSGIVAITAALVALFSGRALDLLFYVYLASSVVGAVSGVAGIIVTRGRRLNGRRLAVAGLILAVFSLLFLYPFAVMVALTHWEFGR